MKFNSMNKENDKKTDYSKYIIIAIASAFVGYFFLNIVGNLLVLSVKVIVKYWWAAILVFLVLLIIKFKAKKKK